MKLRPYCASRGQPAAVAGLGPNTQLSDHDTAIQVPFYCVDTRLMGGISIKTLPLLHVDARLAIAYVCKPSLRDVMSVRPALQPGRRRPAPNESHQPSSSR